MRTGKISLINNKKNVYETDLRFNLRYYSPYEHNHLINSPVYYDPYLFRVLTFFHDDFGIDSNYSLILIDLPLT